MSAKRNVYIDNNATTPVHPEVKKAMVEGFEIFGNASSVHSFGRQAKKHVEEARKKVSGLIGANSPDEVIFTGSGSEANNTVLNTFICECSHCGSQGPCARPEIVTSLVEHPCVLRTAECLSERGTKVLFAKVDECGKVIMPELEKLITAKTGLVSIMMANNEIGTIMDIKAIAKLAHAKGALVHTDAVQALGKIPVDVRDLDVDFLTFSAHKIYGPKGVGGLYIRRGVPFCPMIHGGHQEQGRRAGTENTLGIIGLGRAAEMVKEEMTATAQKAFFLRNKLKDGIEARISDTRFNGHPVDCLPGTLNMSFDGVEGEAVLLYLDLEGIAVSTGSACASGSLDPSHVLLATGLAAEKAHGSIRFSIGRENTEDDIDHVLAKLPMVIEKVRKMSTAYTGRK
jgi:cysteine desulfurase